MNFSKLAKCAVLSGALLAAPSLLELRAERDTADILIDVLVRKGILSESEATSIRDEVDLVAAAEREQVVDAAVAAAESKFSAAAPVSSAVQMPKALDKLNLYGDARFRYQGEDVDDKDIRSRWRYRVRFGADYGFAESPFSMGLRLETSDANDSTNANFGGYFDKVGDEVYFGLAYLTYSGEDLTVTLGKQKQPFMIDGAWWDGDINPEGFSESFKSGDWTFNFGQYVIDEEREDKTGAGKDDFLFVAQAEWSNGEGLSVAPMFLVSTNGTSKVTESATFSGENAIKYFRNFAVAAVPFEYGFKDANSNKHKVFGTAGMNLKGDDAIADVGSPYYSAVDVGDQNMFFNLGYQFGSAKKAGEWQAGLEYRYIGGSSYTPNLSDSDFAKNSLNHAGFILSYKYAVTEFFTAGLTYMNSETIDDDYSAPVVAKDKAQILQLDAAVKF